MKKMLKTVYVAFAPLFAFGRGTGDGTSPENAYEIELLPGSLKLFTYNINNAGTDELQGDLWYGTTSNAAQYSEFVEYGFCFRLSAEGTVAA